MSKKKNQILKPADVQKACHVYWTQAFAAVELKCSDALGQYRMISQETKETLKKQKIAVGFLQKKLENLQAAFEKKKTKAIEKQRSEARQQLKKAGQSLKALEKQVVQQEQQLSVLKRLQAEQKGKIAACKAFHPKYNAEEKRHTKQKSRMTDIATSSSALNQGDRAPTFDAITESSETVSLKDYQGQFVVLYFYPKDDTLGCTQEAKDFTRHADKFAAKNAIVLGVSRDKPTSHQRFKKKHELSITLLSDTNETLCQQYGFLKNKMMAGKPAKGLERTTFLIDPKGIIQQVWRDVAVPGVN